LASTPRKPTGPAPTPAKVVEHYSPLWKGAPKKKTTQAPPTDFMKLAMARFKLASEAESEMRAAALEDMKFRIGQQWPQEIQTLRQTQGRPCLTINRIPQFVRQITNEQRAQRPSITINPIGSGADIETAEVLQGICRHIEVNSNAETAYDTAFEQMVTCGFGYYRLLTAFAGDEGFDQEILVQWVQNQFSVYLDPAATQPDRSDARYAFIVSDVPVEEYPGLYPDSKLASAENMTGVGDAPPGWINSRFVRVAEYFWVEETPGIAVHLLDNGETVEGEAPEGAKPRSTRKRPVRKVRWAVINAIEKLEENDWPGRYIPIIPVLGDDLIVDGKRFTAGIVRDAKDPQRMYNYWSTSGTETIALAPKAPYIAAAGQIENFETIWQAANQSAVSVLPYNPVGVNGQVLPPPQRQQYEPPIQSITNMLAHADNDLKSTTGIYDASLGAPGPEQSGKAVLARQGQSLTANLNWSDNLARSIKFGGRQMIDLIPKVYDAPRVQRIIKPDGSSKLVGVYNSKNGAPPDDGELAGVSKIYDLGVGRYDVSVTVGPSYQSKRQEAAAAQIELLKVNPTVFPLIGDLVVGNMDWPGAQEIAKRLKTMLPPQLQDGDPNDPVTQLAQKNAQLQQLMQQHGMLVQQLQQATQTIQNDQVAQQAKIEIAKIQAQAQVTVAEIGAKVQDMKARAEFTSGVWTEMHQAAHEAATAAVAPPPVAPGAGDGASAPQQPQQQQ